MLGNNNSWLFIIDYIIIVSEVCVPPFKKSLLELHSIPRLSNRTFCNDGNVLCLYHPVWHECVPTGTCTVASATEEQNFTSDLLLIKVKELLVATICGQTALV